MTVHHEHHGARDTRGSAGMVMLIFGLMLSGLGLLPLTVGAGLFMLSQMQVECLIVAPAVYLLVTLTGTVGGSVLVMHRQELLGWMVYLLGVAALFAMIAGYEFTNGWCPLTVPAGV